MSNCKNTKIPEMPINCDELLYSERINKTQEDLPKAADIFEIHPLPNSNKFGLFSKRIYGIVDFDTKEEAELLIKIWDKSMENHLISHSIEELLQEYAAFKVRELPNDMEIEEMVNFENFPDAEDGIGSTLYWAKKGMIFLRDHLKPLLK